ncbi:MAG TPA: hypothetical protein VFN81_06660 [Sphingomicrobium sp.]|nr:hypothetical protein [Sphingomicrobium sp.]
MKALWDFRFPCVNPIHIVDNHPALMRAVLKSWIDGENPVRITCPDCDRHGEPGYRDMFCPSPETLALMIEASRKRTEKEPVGEGR